MKNKTTIIAVVVTLLVVSAGAFYFLTKEDSGTAAKNTTNNTASSTQETQQEETPAVTLSSALSQIGATGSEGPVNGKTYTFNDKKYRFDEPSNWEASMNQRKQACEQGYINTGYQVATDGSTWFATTDFREDLPALVNALKGAGINAEIANYC